MEKEKKEEKNKKEDRELKEIESKLAECEKLKKEYLDGWKRAKADFLNYKKEESERVKDLADLANEKFILQLLPILDNFYIAAKELPENLKENKWAMGIFRIKDQLLDFLRKEGVEEIECLGKKFNPLLHEAIEEVEGGKFEQGIIIEEVKKGYLFNGRVIRPAKVKVAK
ncbi:MAG TPA: nucleotide exchange factor GrpE [Candidatus Parcubacteria bacterium]|nr:nucleotide exchange factor GrpE [Candidatus Parcubacteria bacterium]